MILLVFAAVMCFALALALELHDDERVDAHRRNHR